MSNLMEAYMEYTRQMLKEMEETRYSRKQLVELSSSMEYKTARLIRELKKSLTHSELAKVYFKEDSFFHGSAIRGKEVCALAFHVLYPHLKREGIEARLMSEEFNKENKSKLGNFYWWETV